MLPEKPRRARRASKTEMREREQLMWELLEDKDEAGLLKEIPFKTFRMAIKDRFDTTLTDSAIRRTLDRILVLRNRPGLTLRYSTTAGGKARLEFLNRTVLDERERKRPDVKRALGRFLWNVLYGLELGSTGRGSARHIPLVQLIKSKTMLDKVAWLRAKSAIRLAIDAGSTTYYAVDELLKTGTFPFATAPLAVGGKTPTKGGLLSLTILTNSPRIAGLVIQSVHRTNIGLIIVGGEVRVERASVCGEMAMECLTSWRQERSVDVALIGATGYKPNFDGYPAVGCDDYEEAQIKAALLRATVRIVIFDSSKIMYSNFNSVFTRLTERDVDLVVTDDGKDIGIEKLVREFCDRARKENVETVVVPTKG